MIKYKCVCFEKDIKNGYCVAGIKVSEANAVYADCDECIYLVAYEVDENKKPPTSAEK